MSYNQKPPGPGGSGMGGSGAPPNGPNNMPQVAKTFAGIQQQMQNFVHGQNSLPQSSQADLNAFLQQQRIQNMLKQQHQFLQFQQQMQQQQQHQQQQQQQHHNMSGGGVGVSAGGSGGGPGVGGGGGGGGGSGEPLALTRTPGAAELLNKTYQQTANGNPGATPTLNQLQQTLQALPTLPTNFVQQLQAFQYQMQAKQMHQHAQGGNQQGGGTHLSQQQGGVPQGVPPPPTTGGGGMSHQQQQQQQKHHQQQQNALSTVAAVQQFQQRYLSAAAAQAAASGNKLSSATPPPPPPLTNQMKPPNLPPNTQITPVSGANIGGGVIPPSIASAHQKGSVNTVAAGPNKHQASQPPPSISLTPSKPPTTSGPSAAHQQNKFTPPHNTGGAKGSHSSAASHTQNLPKAPYGGGSNAFNNATSPAKAGANVETAATGAALKSPQSTPVQLTKQTPTAATTATIGNKIGTNTAQTATSTGATATTASQQKTPSATITQAPQIASNTTTTTTTSAAAVAAVAAPVSVVLNPPPPVPTVAAAPSPSATPEGLAKTPISDKVLEKPKSEDNKSSNIGTTSVVAAVPEPSKKEADKPMPEKKVETKASSACKPPAAEASNDIKSKTAVKPETKSTDQNKVEAVVEVAAKTNTEAKTAKLGIANTEEKPKNNNKPSAVVMEDAKETIAEKLEVNKEVKLASSTETAAASSPVEAPAKKECDVKTSEVQNDVKKPIENKASDKKSEDKNEETIDKKCENNGSTIQPLATKVDQTKISDAENSLPRVPIKVVEKLLEATTEKCNQNTDQKTKLHYKPIKPADEEKDVEQKSTTISCSTETAAVTTPLKDTPKENEDSPKVLPLIIAGGKSEVVANAKAADINASLAVASEAVKEVADTTASTAVATTVTPVKKQSRPLKVVKPKPTTIPSEAKTPEKVAEKITPARIKRKSKVESYTSDTTPSTPKDDALDRKSKRHRLKTILYQSPLPELAFITKLSASEASNSPKPMSNEDRLIVFYKNEYMAVRNAEGTFYLCQTMQNVYRTSPRISIRWLSEDSKDSNVYIPDFYDHTDIECVLTTVELKRIDKGHMRLPKTEKTRIESILKKAIDVEKGLLPRPELTEENPDGLDISLFKDESQIEKKSLTNADDQSGAGSGPAGAGRKPRKGNSHASSVVKPASQTPSTTAGYKRKRSLAATATSTSARKSPAKKRKTLVKRKKKKSSDSDDDDDDEEETSDDYESDTEYKPTQKRSSLNTSASKSTPRAQRSPLAKARAASPITPTTSRSRSVPQKTTPTPSPSTSKATRGERAAKRKSLTEVGSSEETPPPAKRPATTSTSSTTKAPNKTKTSENVSLEKEEAIAASAISSDIKASETSVTITPNTSNPNCSSAQMSANGSNGATCGDGDGGATTTTTTNGGNNTPPRSRK